MSPRHPDNTLNELSGEEWLYFTKSVWGTAYPSELGHALRKQHGANKPPRLMARLIEFFTTTGELVLDPFAGRRRNAAGRGHRAGPQARPGPGDRAALGRDLRGSLVRELAAERGGRGPVLADIGSSDPGGERGFDPSGLEMRLGDSLACCLRSSPTASTSWPPIPLQHPAADHDVRRQAGGGARQPPDGLRHGHRA